MVARPVASFGLGLDWALTEKMFVGMEIQKRFSSANSISRNYPVGANPYGSTFKGTIIPSPTENFKVHYRQNTTVVGLSLGYRL